ncbi:MAG TPA: YihA family ribosome biogenesis GTP-binding protein [Desulfobacteraceae bacterium]|nr:YihA family ribosome biogenesis GTP-binding protein [Desulfobacteraceae bacterium]
MNFDKVSFLQSVFSLKSLPDVLYPEIAFAGRSNVGKSSLINCLVNRRNLVKTSSRPGKTQSLNYFVVDESLYLVDLPGYGFARVSKDMQSSWQRLITGYLESRESLACVVVIVDIRHELKEHDRSLVEWLRFQDIEFFLVYTKADKLSGNKQQQNAAILDAGLTVAPHQRILFSAKTGRGSEQIKSRLASYVEK